MEQNPRNPNSRNWDSLPEEIIEKIQTFLYDNDLKTLVRSSFISKAWFAAWSTSPVQVFDERLLRNIRFSSPETITQFAEHISSRLSSYEQHDLPLRSLSLYLYHDFKAHLEEWLDMAMKFGVQMLDLRYYGVYWSAPQNLLAIKSLETLYLFRHSLSKYDTMTVNCHHIKNLTLEDCFIHEHSVNNFISNCPLIEKLIVHRCYGFVNLHMANVNRLSVFDFEAIGDQRVDDTISAPDICEVIYSSYRSRFSNVKLVDNFSILPSGKLRRLELFGVGINDVDFSKFPSKFPNLDDLFLDSCNLLERINVSFASLTRLILSRCDKIREVNIDAPNLRVLKYDGICLEGFSFTNVSPGQLKYVQLGVLGGHFDILWFLKLREALQISRSCEISIFTRGLGQLNDIELKDLRVVSFPPKENVEQLCLRIDPRVSSRVQCAAAMDALFSIFHPKFIYPVCLGNTDECIKLLLQKLMEKDGPGCCTSDANKCWRHYLKDATVGCQKAFEDGEEYDEDGWRAVAVDWGSERLVDLTIKLEWLSLKTC